MCLITGATGALGPSVVAALSRTHDIRTFSRQPPPAGLFPESVAAFTGDIADRTAIRRAATGADVIVHLAALLHVMNPPPSLRPEYERVNVHGTAAVMEAGVSEGVARVVVLSTIAVYGYASGAVINEDSPPRPDTFYAETKLAAERVALDSRRADRTPLATILRSAAVYGPGVKGNYRALVNAMAARRFVPVGSGQNRRTLVFEDDLSSAVGLAAGHPAAAGRIYNVSDGQFHTVREIVAAIAAGLGRRPPAWYVPVLPVRMAVMAGRLVNPRLPRMLDKYLEDVAVDATRIRKELGFIPRFDLQHGWATTVQRMRQRKVLPNH